MVPKWCAEKIAGDCFPIGISVIGSVRYSTLGLADFYDNMK